MHEKCTEESRVNVTCLFFLLFLCRFSEDYLSSLGKTIGK